MVRRAGWAEQYKTSVPSGKNKGSYYTVLRTYKMSTVLRSLYGNKYRKGSLEAIDYAKSLLEFQKKP
jgi:hypothetical protein